MRLEDHLLQNTGFGNGAENSDSGGVTLLFDQRKDGSAEYEPLDAMGFMRVDQPSDQADFYTLSAHSWLLYSRWSWFRSLIDSGMDEFIYCTNLDYKKEYLLEDCEYIASIGGLFRLVDLEDKPEPGYAPFVSHCLNTAKRILGPSTATQPEPTVQEPPEVLMESLDSEDPGEIWAPIS